jgi:deoxyribonuclease-1
VGELNRLRRNYSVTELGPLVFNQFGKCGAKVLNRKYEPNLTAKGIVARTYQYMDLAYPGHGIIPRGNTKQNLYKAWSAMYPVSVWECVRAYRIEQIQKSPNPILVPLCKAKGWYGPKILSQ